jgi:proline dehydrogenase/carbapenem biosynthesis protein (putative proline dehydrogenase)
MLNKFKENKEKYKDNVYHGSLYGFINNDTNKIIESGIKTYKYLPYGKIEDSVPYLMRRLYENPKVFLSWVHNT